MADSPGRSSKFRGLARDTRCKPALDLASKSDILDRVTLAMGKQLRPARVFQTVTEELSHRILPQHKVRPPPWYKALKSIPPTETVIRLRATVLQASASKSRKPRNLFKPQQIIYEEDELRTTFFKDHPWELARPRVVLELDGKDWQRCDWSRGLRQPGLAISGESVVQRQMWLMNNAGLPRDQAYDMARKEFYALRQEEEVEKRVAREEARYVGAYFGKNKLDIAQDLEDKQYETWKQWAQSEVVRIEQDRSASYRKFGKGDEATDDDVAAVEAAEKE
ncbi:hypothetical protein VD0002_g4684 [Verticillium dahliae]|uniref:Small ribosomal subunit protein mS23 n=2 Tax=Verticillium dahliae TaxID=27337 RepID=G2XC69_VERDV|nr:37S ribosomal protein Rsm25 [Verticillium dahliae VdLs.17]PNH32687.1 hypothetical protein BJF96_g3880 [Verticillium dahliae]EGY16587.1 37S ribosomal protein Rsm25 [Verticillium dahliae VdLs.17]PNH43869.1 hypothetical protein VD0004_g3698 [Verticillium dahliae]PNH50901.1 hypothetical protein VD0003_g6307 [Verticillium dahliae]PNH63767.1 hypothetical protein VD0002_g4684 [Verticillium dahliae]